MFRKISHNESCLTLDEVKEIIHMQDYGILGTMGEDGYPYSVPLNYVFENDKLYFHCATSGHKLDNMTYNDKVSFCIVNESRIVPEKLTTDFKSVIVFGNARKTKGQEKENGLRSLIKRFANAYMGKGEKCIQNRWEETVVMAIDIQHITGKKAVIG